MESNVVVSWEVLHNTRSVHIYIIPGNVIPKLRLDSHRCLAIVEVGAQSWTCVLPKNVLWSQPVQMISAADHVTLRLALEPFGPTESVLLQSKLREASESVMPKLQQANNRLMCRLCGQVAIIDGSPFSKVCFLLSCGFLFLFPRSHIGSSSPIRLLAGAC